MHQHCVSLNSSANFCSREFSVRNLSSCYSDTTRSRDRNLVPDCIYTPTASEGFFTVFYIIVHSYTETCYWVCSTPARLENGPVLKS